MSVLTEDQVKTAGAKLAEIGFEKICVVNKSYQTAFTHGDGAVASAYNDAKGTLVNENQELADDWATKTPFCFFKTKYMVVQKSAKHIVGQKGNKVVLGYEIGGHWFVCEGKKKGDMLKDKDAKDSGKFGGAPDAYSTAMTKCFDELEEDLE